MKICPKCHVGRQSSLRKGDPEHENMDLTSYSRGRLHKLLAQCEEILDKLPAGSALPLEELRDRAQLLLRD